MVNMVLIKTLTTRLLKVELDQMQRDNRVRLLPLKFLLRSPPSETAPAVAWVSIRASCLTLSKWTRGTATTTNMACSLHHKVGYTSLPPVCCTHLRANRLITQLWKMESPLLVSMLHQMSGNRPANPLSWT